MNKKTETADRKKAKQLTDHPCPFCGCGHTYRLKMGGYDVFWVECGKCKAHGPEAATLTGAVQAWNIKQTSGWIQP